MRHNSCTVIVLASPAPAEVLGAVGQSMNVTLIRPAEPDASDGAQRLAAAADALRRAAAAPSAYALVTADPLAAVADGWRGLWDLAQPQGPGRFEQEASAALAAWRAGRFELPDYYLVTAGTSAAGVPGGTVNPAPADPSSQLEQDFYLGPLRAARPHRVAFVPAAEPAEQAAGVLQALGSLHHGPWWPGLDELIEMARTFYPGRLSETATALGPPG
ncbi:MAG TPA: hypothetical protein VGI00_22870 [Streptosporangiaceae bacterium]